MENKIKVHYYNNNILKETKDLSWPQHYENFKKDIIQNFCFTNKNTEVILKLVTDECDIYNINSQDELKEYIEENNIKEFRFFIEKKKDSGERKNQSYINSQELEKLLDLNLFTEEYLDIDIDNIINDIFDKDEYIKKKEKEEIEYSNIFNQDLEKNMEEIFSQKTKIMKEEIDTKINNYSEIFFKEQKEAYNFIMDINDNLVDIKDQTEEMSIAIKELHDSIKNNDLILSSTKNLNRIRKQMNENNNLQMSGINNNNIESKNYFKANPIDDLNKGKEEKNAEGPVQQKQKNAEKIFEELKNEFQDYENLFEKNEIFNKLYENDFNKEEIKTFLNNKIKQIQEGKDNKKAEEIYNELNFYNHDLNKDEIISLIKEQNFNKENVQNYINKRISEQIYDNISNLNDIDITNHNKEEVLKKIIELNFNIGQILESFKKIIKRDESVVEPDNNKDNSNNNYDNSDNNDDIDEEEVNRLYLEIEEEYGWNSIIDEEEAKNIIRKLKCNKEAIIDWIQNILLNGGY